MDTTTTLTATPSNISTMQSTPTAQDGRYHKIDEQ